MSGCLCMNDDFDIISLIVIFLIGGLVFFSFPFVFNLLISNLFL